MASKTPRFSSKTIAFLKKASRQRSPLWLERNQDEYERVLLQPLKNLAQTVKVVLQPLAPHYNFPQKGIGRLRRPAHRIKESGGRVYKDWMAYSASTPSQSRFDHNPNLFFLIQTDEPDGDNVLVAGGLYMPSSRQLKAIRSAIGDTDSRFAEELDKLFADKTFSKHFKGGFSDERIAKRNPKGFAVDHPRMNWLKLQAYFVWKPYKMREFSAQDFAHRLSADWRQILRLNALLDKAISGHTSLTIPVAATKPLGSPSVKLTEQLSERLGEVRTIQKPDF